MEVSLFGITQRVTADKRTRTHLLGDFIPTDKQCLLALLVSVDVILNKTGTRQYTPAVLSVFAEIHSTDPISAYIFLLSPTLGLPPQLIDALFGVTEISGLNL